MTLKRVPAFTIIAIVGLGVQVEAQTPCPELVRLRNAATEAWRQAMRVPPSERCGALYQASLAAQATLKYADNNRESCDISVSLLDQVERYHREAVQARDNACAGRPFRPKARLPRSASRGDGQTTFRFPHHENQNQVGSTASLEQNDRSQRPAD